mmetsp:Transcript_67495/g.124193  ORF Transcript_67495/g.124193 Transcript_67495/m.124193 type:complete len:218 (+) Transcript_67495:2586-3239(+)
MLAGFVSALARAAFSSATNFSCRLSTSSFLSRAFCRSCLFCWARFSFSFSAPRNILSVISSSDCSLATSLSPAPLSLPPVPGASRRCTTAEGAPARSSRSPSHSSRNPAFSASKLATRDASSSCRLRAAAISLAWVAPFSASSFSRSSKRCSRSCRINAASRKAPLFALAASSNLWCSSFNHMVCSSFLIAAASARAFALASSVLCSSRMATFLRKP